MTISFCGIIVKPYCSYRRNASGWLLGQINVPVKTCTDCGEVFVIGYHASIGIQFWLTVLTLIGGIVYWAVRGRSERCPKCKGRNYQTVLKTLEV